MFVKIQKYTGGKRDNLAPLIFLEQPYVRLIAGRILPTYNTSLPRVTLTHAHVYTHTHTRAGVISLRSTRSVMDGEREKEREKKVWYKRWRATIRAGVSNDTRQKEQKEIQESRGGIVLSSRTRQLHWLSR